MAFLIEQKVKNTTYVYRSVGYWDKEKQQARHRRICLGKKDPKTGKLIRSKSHTNPRGCRDYGNFHLLNHITEKTGLATIIQKHFPDSWREILTCAFYEISERKPLYLCGTWSEATQTPGDVTLSSQQISTLLQKLGKADRERTAFFRDWAAYRSEQEYLALDITSISSYSQLNEFLEFGYNRDREDLPQINVCMLFGQTSLLPIYYRIVPGSIRDMTTLSNTIRSLEHIDMRNIRFVMDKGFYSEFNVRTMLEKRIKFSLSVPFTTKLAQKLVDKYRKRISTPAHSFMLNGSLLYAIKDTHRSPRQRWWAFVYYDERKQLEAKESLLKRIMECERQLSLLKRNPATLTSAYRKYLTIRRSKNGLHIHRNEAVIADRLRYKGYVVIMTNDIRDAYEALQLYRAKDAVERAFDNMKNELDLKRLRVHSEIAMTGRMFLGFISLILYSWLDKGMKEAELYKRYTQEEMLAELKRLKIVELDEQRSLLTELSKNQKHLFNLLKIPLPSQPLL